MLMILVVKMYYLVFHLHQNSKNINKRNTRNVLQYGHILPQTTQSISIDSIYPISREREKKKVFYPRISHQRHQIQFKHYPLRSND